MHRGIHSSSDRQIDGPAPIGDYLPKLRLRVRTIPTLVWRDGAWRVEWIVVSYPELLHTTGTPRSVHSATLRQA